MATYRQDMPPPGGYKAIDWQKVTRKRVSGTSLIENYFYHYFNCILFILYYCLLQK